MNVANKADQKLIEEISLLKKKIKELKRTEADHKRMEDALRENETKYRTLIETTNTGYVIIDEKGIVLDSNLEYARLTGHSRLGDILGRSVIEWTADYEKKKNEAAVLACLQAGYIRNLEIDYVDSKGHITPIELNATRVEMEGKTRILTLCRNIANRRRAQEALRESEERFKSIVSTSQEWIWAIDLEGCHIFCNPAIENILGYHPDEMIGRSAFHLLHEEDVPKVNELLAHCIEQKTGWPNLVLRWKHKDGTYRYLESNAVPVLDQDGILKGFQGSDRDITERKQSEDERNRLQQRLLQAEKMEAMGTLAGGVAHDLNNVLGILVGYSELLLANISGDSPLRNHIEKIMQGGLRAAAIVQDLLTLARRGVHAEGVINLNSIITDFQKTPEFEHLQASSPHVRIQIKLTGDLLNIRGSSSHVSKTFMNLLANAVEAIPKEGRVTVTTGNRNLDTPVHGYDEVHEGDYVTLEVSDTGEGIAEEDIKHIFEPFYTKKVMGRSGTGLGLAVVWGTVKDHNGYIDVQSKKGEGTTFTLYFPVTREELPTSASVIPLSEYIGKDESILVVDDIKEQRELASRILGNLNYRVTTAASGEEAVDYLKSHRVDLIVLDMIMDSGMDGLAAYKRILEIHPKQKAIIVSGFSESDRVQAAKALGAGAYLRKPYIIEKLGLTVRKELDRLT